MKKIILLTALLVTSYNLFAFTTQGVWRWRNDDGSETAATWKAAQNTPITIHSKDSVIRLRIELYNNGSGGLLDGALFEDSTNEVGGHWDTIKTAANVNGFMLAGSSPFVTDLEPTTHQLNGQALTFVAGKEIVDTNRLPKQTVAKNNTTEFEYVIKPTANIKSGVTYYFRVDAANYPVGYIFPSLVYTESLPHASINDVSMPEGNSGTSIMKFKVKLDHAYSSNVKIKYATADSTAKAAKGDYVAAQGTISFAPGATSASISITINGDTIKERNEKFKVKLSNPTNAILSDSLGIGTIKNDDGTTLTYASTDNSTKIADAESMKILPDPNKGNFTIQMQLPAKEAATVIALYNNSGVQVWRQDMGSIGGAVTKNVYLENKLSPGLYVLMIQRSDVNYSVQLSISK